jgi:molecular chaperone DnaK
MARSKIDYGIDLGTTNSAISRMENGEAVIKKTDQQKDTMASCISFNKKRSIRVGDTAYNGLKSDKLSNMRDPEEKKTNAFIEFKRTMGSDKSYFSEHMAKEYSSEELSSEILKTLKSFVKDESIQSAVVTVPAKFTSNQKDATLRAASIAGFSHCELLQEPIAAAMAYGLTSIDTDGYLLVFDFGGGTFDVALLDVTEGIMKVIDTEGDNYLGGKNIDLAIVDEIIIPYMAETNSIDLFLENDEKRIVLQDAMKSFAEETKIQMSFNESYNILSDLGDIPGEDDDGEEFELDITVTQNMMREAVGPIFQKSIDITKELLSRNHVDNNALKALILVGGPTYSPILREMLGEQIVKPDLSGVDPMTIVSKGAALYAATIDISEEVKEQQRDKSKIQLQLGYESTTVEDEELVTIKLLEDKTVGEIPEKVFVELSWNDNSWSSGKVEIDKSGGLIEVKLKSKTSNMFNVLVYNEQGDLQESEPLSITIIQGSKIGSATLPYSIGIEIKDRTTGKLIFRPIQGLNKNQSTPAVGTTNGLKTQRQIRPGDDEDSLKIAIYQGGHEADGTQAIYNDHVYDVVITGEHLPKLLPEGSSVDLTLKVDKSERITVEAYFPSLDFTHDIEVPRDTTQKEIDENWLEKELNKAIQSLELIRQDGTCADTNKLNNTERHLDEIKNEFDQGKGDYDRKMGILENLRNASKEIDRLQTAGEWPKIEEELKSVFYRLEETNARFDNDKATPIIDEYKSQIPDVIKDENSKVAQDLIDAMRQLDYVIKDEGLGAQLQIAYLNHFNGEFEILEWSDRDNARNILDRGLQMAADNPEKEQLKQVISELFKLLPDADKDIVSGGDGSELIG